MKTLIAALCLAALIMSPSPVSADDHGPTDQLKPIIDELILILADESLQGKAHKTERREQIMTAISGGFDFREMSKRVLGRTWNTLSSKDQDYFVTQMSKLLENVYIGRLETYSGEEVEFVAERIKGKRAQVTTLIEHEGAKLPVHYIMQKEYNTWMVYDINIEGVSLIRNYMEQFKSILRTDKYEGLLQNIEDKNQSFAEGN
jgi:phospholipid transport system substrate-binding protein